MPGLTGSVCTMGSFTQQAVVNFHPEGRRPVAISSNMFNKSSINH